MFILFNGIWYYVIKIYSIYCFMLYNKVVLIFYKYVYFFREVDSDYYWYNEESFLLFLGLKKICLCYVNLNFFVELLICD